MSFLAVPDECGHQGGRDRLPADGFSLFPQLDQALFRVEVLRAQGQGAAPPAGGLGVEAEQQGVEVGVIPGGRRCLVDLREALAGDRVAGRGQAAGLVHLAGRVVRRVDQPVVLGVLVQAAQRSDEVLGGAAPAAGVAPGHHVGPDVLDQLPDLARRGLVDAPAAPCSVTRFQ